DPVVLAEAVPAALSPRRLGAMERGQPRAEPRPVGPPRAAQLEPPQKEETRPLPCILHAEDRRHDDVRAAGGADEAAAGRRGPERAPGLAVAPLQEETPPLRLHPRRVRDAPAADGRRVPHDADVRAERLGDGRRDHSPYTSRIRCRTASAVRSTMS